MLLSAAGSCRQAPPSAAEPEGQYVVVGGKRLWYRTEGQGRPLLLIPGGPGFSHTYFWPHFSGLAKDFTVIYFDAYGRGKSERAKAQSEYTFARDVDEIEGLRQALRLSTISVYGQSYGGMVAQAYATKYPQSLDHLILADTFHSAEMWQKGNDDIWNVRLQDQMPELWDRLQTIRGSGKLSCDPEYQKLQGDMPAALAYYYDPSHADNASYGAIESNLDVYCQLAGPDADVILGGDIARLDFRPLLGQIATPTLILAGRFDRVAIPRFAIEFKRLMPQATFVMFEKSGHYPFIEESELHGATVRAFLNGTRNH
jgi:proline iminopeptidase